MMERKVKKAFERQTPDVLSAVLAECGGEDDCIRVTPPEKRKPWLGIVCSAAILALVVSIGAFVWKNKPMNQGNETTATETAEIDVKKLVTDAYRGSWNGYEYAIPKILIDSPYAKVVNAEIERSYFPDDDGVVREERNLSYECFASGNILSIVYYIPDDTTVYTLNISDGSEATREDVLAQAGVSLADYLQRLFWDLGNSVFLSPEDNIILSQTICAMNLDTAKPFLADDELRYLGLVYYEEEAERKIFRYDEPVEESASFKQWFMGSDFYSYLAYPRASGTYTEADGSTLQTAVPLVLLDSDYADAVNDEIWELCSAYIDENGDLMETVKVEKHSNQNSGILSVWMIIEDGKHTICRSYNFNIEDGSKAGTEQMIAYDDTTIEKFKKHVRRELIDYYCTVTDEDLRKLETLSPEFIKTVSDENIDATVPVFWGVGLVVPYTVYTPNGEYWTYSSVRNDSYACQSAYVGKMEALYESYLLNQPADPNAITPLQIEGDNWQGKMVTFFVNQDAIGMSFENAEGETLYIDDSRNAALLTEEDWFIGGNEGATVKYEIPYSAAFTFSDNISENFFMRIQWPTHSIKVEGSSIERAVLSISGIELFGTNMRYTLLCEGDFAPELCLEVSGTGESHVKLQCTQQTLFVHAMRECKLRVLQMIYGSETVTAQKKLAPLSECEVKIRGFIPTFNGERICNTFNAGIDPTDPIRELHHNDLQIEGSEYAYDCVIPMINCPSSYAKKVNQELDDYYMSTFAPDGTWYGMNASYDYYINGDILSLVVYLYNTEKIGEYEADLPHKIYNIRISDGTEVTADEVLQAAGVSKEDFRTRVREMLGSYYLSILQPQSEWERVIENPEDNYMLGHFADTVSEINLDSAVPFLADDGKLHFMGRVYLMAGGLDYETPLFSYSDEFELSPYYEAMLALC